MTAAPPAAITRNNTEITALRLALENVVLSLLSNEGEKREERNKHTIIQKILEIEMDTGYFLFLGRI